jgi:hypothetical protein
VTVVAVVLWKLVAIKVSRAGKMQISLLFLQTLSDKCENQHKLGIHLLTTIKEHNIDTIYKQTYSVIILNKNNWNSIPIHETLIETFRKYFRTGFSNEDCA